MRADAACVKCFFQLVRKAEIERFVKCCRKSGCPVKAYIPGVKCVPDIEEKYGCRCDRGDDLDID